MHDILIWDQNFLKIIHFVSSLMHQLERWNGRHYTGIKSFVTIKCSHT